MPRLKSGRHICFSISPYLEALADEQDEARYFAVVALRSRVPSAEHLIPHIVIGYFHEDQGAPPDAPNYHSGYCIGDVLDARTDWSEEECRELRAFIETEARFRSWLETQFADLDQAIRENTVWTSPLLQDESDEINVNTLKRAIVEKSARAPDSMAQLGRREIRPGRD